MFQPEEVKRDKQGFWLHSAIREAGDDVDIPELIEAEGAEFNYVAFEQFAPKELTDLYDFGCSLHGRDEDCINAVQQWQPQPSRPGEGWLLIAIYDTDDGPYACFARPLP